MSENTASGDASFKELEARLHELLRKKYHEHWRGKDGGELDEAGKERLTGLQAEIRETFDAIRLIDRKYKIPSLDMHPGK